MDLLSLLTSIPGMMSNFSGSSAPYLKQQNQLAQQQQQISGAMMDTNNPLYKQLYGQYQQQGANNMAQMIAQAQSQNRLNSSMGRTPLFDPSRGGETLFRSMMQGYQNMGTQSDQQTRQALQGASQAGTAGLNAYNQITPTAASATAQNTQGYKDIYNVLRPQQQYGTMNPISGGYNPGMINWNQNTNMQTGSQGGGYYPQQNQNTNSNMIHYSSYQMPNNAF